MSARIAAKEIARARARKLLRLPLNRLVINPAIHARFVSDITMNSKAVCPDNY